MSATWPRPSRRELLGVAAIVLLGIALRLAYILITKDHTLAGDEIEYDIEARFAADGKFLWSTTPYGMPHESFWKSPGYAAWVGVLYKLLGSDPDRVFAVQAASLSGLSIALSWALGRRLFTPAVGVATAVVAAAYPNVWQFDVRLFSEGLAMPITLLVLLLVLGARSVSWRRAVGIGALVGALLLIKPSSLLLLAPIAVIWWALAGLRGGTLRLALTVLAMVLVVTPWSIRNHNVDPDQFVPISVQSAAGYGVFNDDAANDERFPWAWRPATRRDARLFTEPRSEGALYAELNRRTRDYILDHPLSVPQAFLHNGLLRLWDLRSPSDVLLEVKPQGRTRLVAAVGLAMYWPLLVLALIALVVAWRAGRRRLVVAVAAMALAASVIYTSNAFTRYRVPFEPLIAALAMSLVVPRLPTGRLRPGERPGPLQERDPAPQRVE